MKKRGISFILIVSIILILSLSIVSASISDFFKNLFKKNNEKNFNEELGSINPNSIQGILSYYHFDGNTNDIIGGKNGVAYGVPFIEGISGTAYEFNGKDNYIDLGTNSYFRQVNSFTYSFWIKIPLNGGGHAFGTGVNGGQGYGGVSISNSSVCFHWTPTNPNMDNYICGEYQFDNEWNHIAITIDFKSKTSSIYVNKNKLSIKTYRVGDIDWTPKTSYSNRQDTIGARFINKFYYFNGSIDELKIWNRVLGEQEIFEEYNSLKQSTTPIDDNTKNNTQEINETIIIDNNQTIITPSNETLINQTAISNCTPDIKCTTIKAGLFEKTTCVDLNDCRDSCSPNWNCTEWKTSLSSSTNKTRICIDLNHCNTSIGKPSELQKITPQCIPNCNGKVCGDDGCGKSCGTCVYQCAYGKCFNNNLIINNGNTKILAGIYMGSQPGLISYNPQFKYIDGIQVCCGFETNRSLADFYHSKNKLVMAHVGSKEEAIKAAENQVDIIVLDEFKSARKMKFTGTDFNQLKAQIKSINPSSRLGIVDLEKTYYDWYKEGADPEFIGLEKYVKNGKEGGMDHYAFIRDIASKFPKADVQIWINSIGQLKKYEGNVEWVILFGVERKKDEFEKGWPLFNMNDIATELNIIHGEIGLLSSSAPESVMLNSEFDIKCNFGSVLPCISANHGENSCKYITFYGNDAIFKCKATSIGSKNNYCNTFVVSGNNKCTTNRKIPIQKTKVISKAIIKESDCNAFEEFLSWFGLDDC